MTAPPWTRTGDPDLRALTEPELESYFCDRRAFPEAVVTDRGVLVPMARASS